MATSLTRRQVARYAAQEIARQGESSTLFQKIAQWLVETKSVRSAPLLVADIEKFLAAEHGIVYAQIITAQPLEGSLRAAIKQLLRKDANTKIVITDHIDKSILGGVIVQTSEKELDASVARSIKKLKALI